MRRGKFVPQGLSALVNLLESRPSTRVWAQFCEELVFMSGEVALTHEWATSQKPQLMCRLLQHTRLCTQVVYQAMYASHLAEQGYCDRVVLTLADAVEGQVEILFPATATGEAAGAAVIRQYIPTFTMDDLAPRLS
jgi:hypothetical protein